MKNKTNEVEISFHSLFVFIIAEKKRKIVMLLLYLMFLDSDDCYAKNACELMYNMATTRNADVVTANYRCMTEERTIMGKCNI